MRAPSAPRLYAMTSPRRLGPEPMAVVEMRSKSVHLDPPRTPAPPTLRERLGDARRARSEKDALLKTFGGRYFGAIFPGSEKELKATDLESAIEETKDAIRRSIEEQFKLTTPFSEPSKDLYLVRRKGPGKYELAIMGVLDEGQVRGNPIRTWGPEHYLDVRVKRSLHPNLVATVMKAPYRQRESIGQLILGATGWGTGGPERTPAEPSFIVTRF